jgi:hypothetical protein
VFSAPKYVQQNYSIVFTPILDIRRKANDFEDFLKDSYSIPQVIPIPDDFDANAPRIIFSSEHGFSNIFISQLSITFQVSFDETYQTDEGLRKNYLEERIPILYKLLGLVNAKIAFSGLVTSIDIPSEATEEQLISHLKTVVNAQVPNKTYDIRSMLTYTLDDYYFTNTLIENYRNWNIEESSIDIPRLTNDKVIEKGIRIKVDVNDRYAFNENKNQLSNDTFKNILMHNINESNNLINRIIHNNEV